MALLNGKPAESGRLVVPLYRRQTYAMDVYTKTRASELEAVTVNDVDLERATIAITKQADRTSKARKATRKTKTKRARTPQGKNGRLLRMPPPEDRAELLPKDLRTVGATRAALLIEGDPVERAVTFHDLRDMGLTHMAVRGDSPIVIQWAGGHSDFKTTQGYLDRGKVEARRVGDPLPPLPAKLLHETEEPAKNIAPESPGTISNFLSSRSHSRSGVTPTGIEPVLPT
jgi:integrase